MANLHVLLSRSWRGIKLLTRRHARWSKRAQHALNIPTTLLPLPRTSSRFVAMTSKAYFEMTRRTSSRVSFLQQGILFKQSDSYCGMHSGSMRDTQSLTGMVYIMLLQSLILRGLELSFRTRKCRVPICRDMSQRKLLVGSISFGILHKLL